MLLVVLLWMIVKFNSILGLPRDLSLRMILKATLAGSSITNLNLSTKVRNNLPIVISVSNKSSSRWWRTITTWTNTRVSLSTSSSMMNSTLCKTMMEDLLSGHFLKRPTSLHRKKEIHLLKLRSHLSLIRMSYSPSMKITHYSTMTYIMNWKVGLRLELYLSWWSLTQRWTTT